VGEGIQAKRRAMGVMVSHLTPPLETTKLYDNLLELRQLVETWESSNDPDSSLPRPRRETLRERLQELDMVQDIEKELAEEHHGEEGHDEEEEGKEEEAEETVHLEDVDDELLVHEVGHYLTTMQESFMPLGLHVFGRDWDQEGIDTMLNSMAGDDEEPKPEWREKLKASPGEEMADLLAGLDGRFVPPGQGNDPVRTPEVLPTGRNFHALSSDLVPTRVAWSLGADMAKDARNKGDPKAEGSEAIVLWASDTVRDEGVMIAFGLDMLGIKPKWNSRGIVEGLERLPLEDRARRRDALFTTSGLFRDLYEEQLVLLDQASRLALDGAYKTIMQKHPQLDRALETAVEPLPEDMRDPGSESLAKNDVAARWGWLTPRPCWPTAPMPKSRLRRRPARLRHRPRLLRRRREPSRRPLRRLGRPWQGRRRLHPPHGLRLRRQQERRSRRARRLQGPPGQRRPHLPRPRQPRLRPARQRRRLRLPGRPLHGRGTRNRPGPDNRVLMHADPDNPRVESLQQALLSELRGQNLNPQWIKPLMEQGLRRRTYHVSGLYGQPLGLAGSPAPTWSTPPSGTTSTTSTSRTNTTSASTSSSKKTTTSTSKPTCRPLPW